MFSLSFLGGKDSIFALFPPLFFFIEVVVCFLSYSFFPFYIFLLYFLDGIIFSAFFFYAVV